ncbi:hypothetical protein JOE63_002841 [Cellulosimicrobium cellulans]|nr:hypothetical protein [Cellulosimicrobium cellulans]
MEPARVRPFQLGTVALTASTLTAAGTLSRAPMAAATWVASLGLRATNVATLTGIATASPTPGATPTAEKPAPTQSAWIADPMTSRTSATEPTTYPTPGRKLDPPDTRFPVSHASEFPGLRSPRIAPRAKVRGVVPRADLDVDPQRVETPALPVRVLKPVVDAVTTRCRRGRELCRSPRPRCGRRAGRRRCPGRTRRARGRSAASPSIPSPSVSATSGSE